MSNIIRLNSGTDTLIRAGVLQGLAPVGPTGPAGNEGLQGVQGIPGDKGRVGPIEEKATICSSLADTPVNTPGGSTSESELYWDNLQLDSLGAAATHSTLLPGVGVYFVSATVTTNTVGTADVATLRVALNDSGTIALMRTNRIIGGQTVLTASGICRLTSSSDVIQVFLRAAGTSIPFTRLFLARIGPGPRGPQGPVGPAGVAGPPGLTGATGPTGAAVGSTATFAYLKSH